MTYIAGRSALRSTTTRAFNDNTNDIDERATECMGFRTKPHIKQVIQRAAALSGVEDSVFTMSATYQPALATIAAHERTHLQPGDHAASFEALDTPPEPTDALRNAVARYQALPSQPLRLFLPVAKIRKTLQPEAGN